MINDAHIHFFSPGFFAGLGADQQRDHRASAGSIPSRLKRSRRAGSESSTRTASSRAALIASLPGDVDSVAKAVATQRVALRRLLHARSDARGRDRARAARARRGPAHHLPVPGDASLCAARRARRHACSSWRRPARRHVEPIAVFVHCGVLSVGVRKKLNLPSAFEMRFGNPLDLHGHALKYPGRADHHSALRRRHAARSVDARGLLSERVSRHLELELVDQVHPRLDARAGLQDRAGCGRSRSPASSVPTHRSSRADGMARSTSGRKPRSMPSASAKAPGTRSSTTTSRACSPDCALA